jgi:tetratricopeptide (TPR) repeat protein
MALLNCTNKRTLEYADLLDTIGSIHERQSHMVKALDCFREMLDISLELATDPTDERVPRAYNAVTNGLVGLWKAKEAIPFATKAVEFGPSDLDPNQKVKLFNPDRYLRCRACAYLYAGDLDKAKEDLESAEHWQILKHGPNSHYLGEFVAFLILSPCPKFCLNLGLDQER